MYDVRLDKEFRANGVIESQVQCVYEGDFHLQRESQTARYVPFIDRGVLANMDVQLYP